MTNRDKTIEINKQLLIEGLLLNRSIIKRACDYAGVDRKTFYNYYNSDPEFAKSCDETEENAIDEVEGKLHDAIDQGSEQLIKYYLSTKGKKRGYGNSIDIDANVKTDSIQILPMTSKSLSAMNDIFDDMTNQRQGKDSE